MTLLAHPEQSLAEHLKRVSEKAALLAENFGGSDHARVAGLLHDLGKAEQEFQKRINHALGKSKEDGKKQPHALHGTALALERQLWPVAFSIYGHHAGLHNRSDLQQVPSNWHSRALACQGALTGDPDWDGQPWPLGVSDFGKPLPPWLDGIPFATASERDAKMRAVDFYTRMLFSALVDADRLDTEVANTASGSQANALKRKEWRFGHKGLATAGAMESLIKMLEAAINQRVTTARSKNASNAVLDVRADVLHACNEKAVFPRGVFTLAVPTGGGKTLASIAFALHHIAHHNRNLAKDDSNRLRRIIVVIPYLNIIQQTTRELKDVFGHDDATDPIILEHHSQATDPKVKVGAREDADGYDKERPRRQLAAENWGAPIIVTTSVQFFDSLFSRRPSDARKLHNICQSVLIFDEVQTLPPLLLQPILDALKELTAPNPRPFGCSLVLCTATQPSLNKTDDFEFGFENVTPIISPAIALKHFTDLKRVEYHGLAKDRPPPTFDHDAVAAAMIAVPQKQALAVLNTRRQACGLFEVLAEKTRTDGDLHGAVFHLSTWMYPAHRLQVLAEVTKRLRQGKPCFLVATQCVEAGVDVDFPAVWRAFGPYDSPITTATPPRVRRCTPSPAAGACRRRSWSPIVGASSRCGGRWAGRRVRSGSSCGRAKALRSA
ncbi:MAG: CRISPR-associated endonuclease Cas3'' [Acidobacteriia bacterium]|nr:CRISPR-associated endonuclease Cas3'' [Terriglobia bacterium]